MYVSKLSYMKEDIMKKFVVTTIFSTALVCFLPLIVSAAQPANYIVAKAGAFAPQSDDLTNNGANYGARFDGEIAAGYYFSPYLAGELGTGWFQTAGAQAGIDTDIKAIPITFTAKILYPPLGDLIEPYMEAGVGLYLCSGDLVSQNTRFSDHDNALGAHLGLGVNFNMTPNIFVGIEGRYLWVNSKFEYNGADVNAALNGIATTANLGYRF